MTKHEQNVQASQGRWPSVGQDTKADKRRKGRSGQDHNEPTGIDPLAMFHPDAPMPAVAENATVAEDEPDLKWWEWRNDHEREDVLAALMELWAALESQGRLKPVGLKRSGGGASADLDEDTQAYLFVVETEGYERAYPAILDFFANGGGRGRHWGWRTFQRFGISVDRFSGDWGEVCGRLGWWMFRKRSVDDERVRTPDATCKAVVRGFVDNVRKRMDAEGFVIVKGQTVPTNHEKTGFELAAEQNSRMPVENMRAYA